jgi:hypothetical protein
MGSQKGAMGMPVRGAQCNRKPEYEWHNCEDMLHEIARSGRERGMN